jgi:hypothetical protein
MACLALRALHGSCDALVYVQGLQLQFITLGFITRLATTRIPPSDTV